MIENAGSFVSPGIPFIVLMIAIVAYVLLLWRWPNLWLPVLMATLPVLDFAPWTGQFFFDEYDWLILLTVSVVLTRRAGLSLDSTLAGWSTTSRRLFLGIAWSGLISVCIGAYPFPSIDLNSFNNYLSPYNALRVGKGLLWAGLLLLLLGRDITLNKKRTLDNLTLGFNLGALGCSLAIIWERLCFTGLLNFESGYRVVGFFSGMHTGGAYVEGYLATAMPFVMWAATKSKNRQVQLGAGLIFLLGCYALLVTYARGGYIAFLLSCAVLFSGLWWRDVHSFKKNNYAIAALLVTLIAGWGLYFSYHDTPMHRRFNNVQPDSVVRVDHWREVLALMDGTWSSTIFGEGEGSMIRRYQQHAGGEVLSEYRYVSEQGANYLQLTGGDPLYYEQIIDLDRAATYDLNVVARNRTGNSELYVTLCQKWMLYAEQCQWYRSSLLASDAWKTFHFPVLADPQKPAPWYARPTVKLSIANYQDGSVADIASVSLKNDAGRELVGNGHFAQGSRYWFFSTENHLPWHYKNLFLQIYFEQGLLGSGLMLALLLYCAVLLVRRRSEPGFPAPLFAAALTGFLTVGLIDSLFDFPRMSMIFYLIVMLIQFQPYTPTVRTTQ